VQRLDAIEQHLGAFEQRMGAFEQRIEGRLDALEVRLKEFTEAAVRELETKLLGTMHDYPVRVEGRLEETQAVQRALQQRVENHSRRLGMLETKLRELEKKIQLG
jgi:hypothetical protein